MDKSAINQHRSQKVSQQLERFVESILVELDRSLDKRLVQTFLLTLHAILMFRHNSLGLLLSELGGYITNPEQAPAGTKRLSNLLRSKRWTYRLIERFLWQRADQQVTDLLREGEVALVVWDESVWEKPESLHSEGLSAVRSSQAQRLKRIKRGFYNPPGGHPVFVPGLNWISLLVLGLSGVPCLAAMRWWSTRGKFATTKDIPRQRLLKLCARWWGQAVIHVWDRGFGNGPWLTQVLHYPLRFVVRWTVAYHLVDAQGQKRAAWKITRGKRSLDHRLIWDARRHCYRKTGIYFCSGTHPDHPLTPLWLVVSRPGPGQKPMYVLTNEPVLSVDQAWHIVFIYMRRWQVEMAYRFVKTDLAIQSPRLWHWQTASNCCSWSPSSMLSSYPSSLLISRLSVPGSCVIFAIEPESGTEKPRYRFIACALL
jgi:hypothetical protein